MASRVSEIQRAADRFRAARLAQERVAVRELVRAYGIAWRSVRKELDRLLRKLELARAKGEVIQPVWLMQQARLNRLLQAVRAELDALHGTTEGVIRDLQRDGIRIGREESVALLRLSMSPTPPGVDIAFAELQRGALQELVGYLSDGSPLRDLLDKIGIEASEAIRSALIRGVALGLGPRQLARDMRRGFSTGLHRSLTIARTEMMRAYREASRQTYMENRDVVRGWTWHAALDSRTCIACIEQHGGTHPLDEVMNSHPNCRCAMIPLTVSWAELGFTDIAETAADIEAGRDWFARQTESVQRRALGPTAFDLYRQGKLRIEDMVRVVESKQWGRYKVRGSKFGISNV